MKRFNDEETHVILYEFGTRWFDLAELTDGLSSPHRDRVYEIAEVLRQKGFARDASQDRPHVLSKETVRRYVGQIAFLESFGDSGAYRFQCYRLAKVIAVGFVPMFASLVSALLVSGRGRGAF
ncbi:hypothetical protein SAMN04487897_10323 [Paenibacillus sp. yr247]|nr:hypothetical protein SAMN04487897_10323 [Paenibacillus sp. yr247]